MYLVILSEFHEYCWIKCFRRTVNHTRVSGSDARKERKSKSKWKRCRWKDTEFSRTECEKSLNTHKQYDLLMSKVPGRLIRTQGSKATPTSGPAVLPVASVIDPFAIPCRRIVSATTGDTGSAGFPTGRRGIPGVTVLYRNRSGQTFFDRDLPRA